METVVMPTKVKNNGKVKMVDKKLFHSGSPPLNANMYKFNISSHTNTNDLVKLVAEFNPSCNPGIVQFST